MFEGQVESSKTINLLYDDVERHYHVITNLTCAMARKYYVKHTTRHVQVTSNTSLTRRVATAWPILRARYPMFANPAPNLTGILKAARVSLTTSGAPQRNTSMWTKAVLCTCEWVVTHEEREYNQRLCDNCNQNKEIRHLCCMRPMKDALPPQVIRYCTYSMMSKLHKILGTRTRLSYTYLISSACFSSVRDARTRETKIACDAVRGSTLSGKILWRNFIISHRTTPLGQ